MTTPTDREAKIAARVVSELESVMRNLLVLNDGRPMLEQVQEARNRAFNYVKNRIARLEKQVADRQVKP